MKKNLVKKTLAVVTSFTLVLGTTTSVFATGSVSDVAYDEAITVSDADLEAYVYDVEMPIDLSFSIDPFEGATTRAVGQLASDYPVQNFSDFPVRATYDLTFTGVAESGTGGDPGYVPAVQFVASADKVSPDDMNVATKRAFVGIVAAKSSDGTDGVYDEDEEDAIFGFTPSADKTTASGKFTFALAKVGEDYDTTSFSMYAQLDTYGAWADDDLVLSGAYTLTGLKPSTLSVLNFVVPQTADNKTAGKEYCLLSPVPSAAGFMSGSTVEVTVSKSGAKDKVIPFKFPEGTVTAVTLKIGTNTYTTTDFSYSEAGNSITLKGAGKLVGGGVVSATPYTATLSVTAGGTTTSYTVKLTIVQ